MITTTVGAVIDGTAPGYGLAVYIIRDGETVFYVGMSWSATQRVQDHCNPRAFRGWTEVGRFIDANIPDSLNWQVDFLPYDDCEGIFKQAIGRQELRLRPLDVEYIVRDVETRLIAENAPCFNVIHNIRARAIPSKYKSHINVERLREAHRRAFGGGDG